MNDNNRIARKIVSLRESHGLTLEQLAIKMGEILGAPIKRDVPKVMSRQRDDQLRLIYAYAAAKVLGVTLDELIDDTYTNNKKSHSSPYLKLTEISTVISNSVLSLDRPRRDVVETFLQTIEGTGTYIDPINTIADKCIEVYTKDVLQAIDKLPELDDKIKNEVKTILTSIFYNQTTPNYSQHMNGPNI